jgi:mannose-binding lectin 2
MILFLLCLFLSIVFCSELQIDTRFTLEAPFYNQFQWKVDGSAMFTEDHIQLTPDVNSQTGQLWSREQFEGDFEVNIQFVVGSPKSHGADGFAFWFTEKQGTDGILFGNVNKFNGLGVIFDSFDKSRWFQVKQFPAIYAIHGSGHQEFENNGDEGARNILWKKALGFQSYDFRDTNENIHQARSVYAVVRYVNGVLLVDVDRNRHSPDGIVENNRDWLRLFEVPIELPKRGYFGFTAATGGVSDHHLIQRIVTFRLVGENIPDREAKKYIGTDSNHLNDNVEKEKHEVVEKIDSGEQGVEQIFNEISLSSEQLNNHLHLQFDEFKEHIQKVNARAFASIAELRKNLDIMYLQLHLSASHSDEVKNKLPETAQLVSTLTEKVNGMFDVLLRISTKVGQTNEVHKEVAAQLESKATGHSITFWVFFAFYQTLFLIMLVFWRLKKSDKMRRL